MSLIARIEPRLAALQARFEEVERVLADPEVAGRSDRLQGLLRERGRLDRALAPWRALREVRAELARSHAELEAAGSDEELRALCEEVVRDQQRRCSELEAVVLEAFVTEDEDDARAVMLEIRAGAGGDEAALWAGDLLRLYLRFADRRRWKAELVEQVRTGQEGIKTVVCSLEGEGVWAALRYESGVHRVQRVPVTESKGRIHTSTATVAVLLQPGEVEVQIDEADLEIETFCASGPGGQKVNKTASAIRITHRPTGVVVSCQDEKSQHRNKARALQVLRARLYDARRERERSERAADRRRQVGTGDRSEKIRTYNYPQGRVTDHRLARAADEEQAKDFSLDPILEGQLEKLVESLSRYDRALRLEGLAESSGAGAAAPVSAPEVPQDG